MHPRLVAAMLLSTGRLDDAADAADEALARTLERWDRVSIMASPEGWTFRVAYNLLRRRARRRDVEARVLRLTQPRRQEEPMIPGPAGEAWSMVDALPRRQREAIVLRYVADLPEAEIAAVMGVSRGTVSASLVAARRTLGDWLRSDEQGGDT